MDDRVISLISCLGPFMSAAQNQMLSDVGRELYQLRAELEAEREKVKHLEQMLAGYASYHSIEAQLAAAQATIADMREALSKVFHHGMWPTCDMVSAAYLLPPNQDALHEALARAVESAAQRIVDELEGVATEDAMRQVQRTATKEAAAHRARKEGK